MYGLVCFILLGAGFIARFQEIEYVWMFFLPAGLFALADVIDRKWTVKGKE